MGMTNKGRKILQRAPYLVFVFDNPLATTNPTRQTMAKTSLQLTDIVTFSPKSRGGNLGHSLRYKLGCAASITAEKCQSYQCAGRELVSSRPHQCKTFLLSRQ